ncbi:cytochrome b [Luteimonas aquatica]|uniref:cytochrome b n=1 Tax=Luteimonas aquatica TaxID=450364 RepID=UPI001F59EB0B|nr:cytochrome b [Luteimonas aquatica]
MTLKNPPDRWGPVSQALHWLIVLLILALAVVGLTMGDLPKTPKYFWVFTLHKSLGITVLALVLARLAWRLYAGAPRPVAGTPPWQARVASLAHWVLYALILAMPISGWLYDSSSGLRPFKLFGLVTMPKLSPPNESLRALSHDAHAWLFWVLVALVALHAGAAFYHHLFQRDDTLARMLPRGLLKPSPQPLPQEPDHVP